MTEPEADAETQRNIEADGIVPKYPGLKLRPAKQADKPASQDAVVVPGTTHHGAVIGPPTNFKGVKAARAKEQHQDPGPGPSDPKTKGVKAIAANKQHQDPGPSDPKTTGIEASPVEEQRQDPSSTDGNTEVVVSGGTHHGAVIGPQTNYKGDYYAGELVNVVQNVHHHHYPGEASNKEPMSKASARQTENRETADTTSARVKQSPPEGCVQICSDIFMYNKTPLKRGTNVFEGYQEISGHRVPLAIKRISPYDDKNFREVGHLASLASHPNIVRILRSETCEGKVPELYIAMELCSSQTLQDYLKENCEKNTPFDFDQTMTFTKQLVSGIKHIHQNKIAHRDLKPENILISLDGGQIKVSDFGISKEIRDGNATKQTSLGGGTDGYRAPETFKSKDISKSADIFSLGLVLYPMWSNGKHAFGMDVYKRNSNIIDNKGRDLSGLLISGTKANQLRNLFDWMLQPDPKKRPTIEQVDEHTFFKSGPSPTAEDPSNNASSSQQRGMKPSLRKPTNEDSLTEQSRSIVHHPSATNIPPATPDVLGNLAEWTQDMRQDINAKLMSQRNKERLYEMFNLYFDITKEQRQEIGDQLALKGGGEVFTEYMRFLRGKDGKVPLDGSEHFECLRILRSLYLNYTKASPNLCLELGKAGSFPILLTDLQCRALEDGVHNQVIMPCLSILYNCSKVSGNRRYLKKANALEVLIPYSTMQTDDFDGFKVKVIATLALSYIAEEVDEIVIPFSKRMITFVIDCLKNAIESEGHIYNGLSAEELVIGLTKMAGKDDNKIFILNEGVIPLLQMLMKTGDMSENTACCDAVWTLSFSAENKIKIRKEKNMMASLQKLPKEKDFSSAEGTLWCLYGEEDHMKICETKETEDSRKSCKTSSIQNKHIMISYSWPQQEIMLRIKQGLEKKGYKVWMDVDKMAGSILESIAKAVENSYIFLMGVSSEYKDSQSCRIEAEYAYRRKVRTIPIKVEQNYNPEGWLEIIQGNKLYIDFSNLENFETAFVRLMKEIDNHKVDEDTVDGSFKNKESVESWTTEEVQRWAIANNIPTACFQQVDGKALLYLRYMKGNSQFYHKYITEKLGITELPQITNLDQALKNLKI